MARKIPAPSLKDRLLWRQVTKDIAAFRPLAPLKEEQPTQPDEEFKDPAFVIKPKPRAQFGRGAGIDRSTEEKLKRGKMPIDGTLDLHGFTQTEAYSALQNFIRFSVQRNRRCLLIVTGKGRMNEGILRQSVPRWLKEPDLSQYILSVQTARPKDGGDGALYVLLRRARQT